MLELSGHLLALGWAAMFFRPMGAGFLIASMVWLIPSAEGAKFEAVTMATSLIAIAGFTHIVTGSVKGFTLVLAGQGSLWQMIARFTIPVLLGDIVGGGALFAVISYAQVMNEM